MFVENENAYPQIRMQKRRQDVQFVRKERELWTKNIKENQD